MNLWTLITYRGTVILVNSLVLLLALLVFVASYGSAGVGVMCLPPVLAVLTFASKQRRRHMLIATVVSYALFFVVLAAGASLALIGLGQALPMRLVFTLLFVALVVPGITITASLARLNTPRSP